MELYEILRKERRLRELSQKELSTLTGVSLVTINMLEKGKSNANMATVKKLCEALGYDIILTKKTNTNENNCN